MGIKLLTTYIKKHFDIKEEFNIKENSLVFDGNGLFHTLMGKSILGRSCSNRYGGDYNDLYNRFKQFFEKLRHWNVTSYIVLDGGSTIPLKTETICERRKNNIRSLRKLATDKHQYHFPKPLFVKMVFIEVLQDMAVNYVVASGY